MTSPVGTMLREWRQRRRLSQLDLALEAEISARHLSFLETGKARPSREMVLHLADQLGLPLRDQNVMLVAAGFAPAFPERDLRDPALAAARRAVEMVLKAQEPYPALAVDRHWVLQAANGAVGKLLVGAADVLLKPPVNVLRLSLHPQGFAPRILNLAEWRGHILHRLRRQVEISADPVLIALAEELAAYPAPRPAAVEAGALVIPLRLATAAGTLSLFSTTTVFGTPVDITLQELAVESFFPADDATERLLRG